MRRFSTGQLKALSEYFNTVATTWFSAGVIAPFFAKVSFLERTIFFLAGFAMSYIFLNLSLFFVKEVNS